jgi:hypothetical protein
MRPDLYPALALAVLLVGCGRSSEIRGIYVNQDGAGTLFPCDDARIAFSVQDSALQARYRSLTSGYEPVFVRLRARKSRSGSPKGGGQRHLRVQEILEIRARAQAECPDVAHPIPPQLSTP